MNEFDERVKYVSRDVYEMCRNRLSKMGHSVCDLEKVILDLCNLEGQSSHVLDVIQHLIEHIKEKDRLIKKYRRENTLLKNMICCVNDLQKRKKSSQKLEEKGIYLSPPHDKSNDEENQRNKYSLPSVSTTKILSTENFLLSSGKKDDLDDQVEILTAKALPLHISTEKFPLRRVSHTAKTPVACKSYPQLTTRRATSACSPACNTVYALA